VTGKLAFPAKPLARDPIATGFSAQAGYALIACTTGGLNWGVNMRNLIACAIIIATTIGIAGCFHHQTVSQPLKVGEMTAK
jgi:hypothetical protein